MNELTNMPNIGKALAERMAKADILSADALIMMGAKTAFLCVKTVYPEACINHLYAMEGAIQGIRWHHLSDDTKKDLKAFYNAL